MKRPRQPLPSLPSRLPTLISHSLSLPYVLRNKQIFPNLLFLGSHRLCPPPHVACVQTAGSVILRACLEIQRRHWGCPRVSCSRRELHAQTRGRSVVLLNHQMEGVSPWTGSWSHKRILNASTAKETEGKPFDCDSPKITPMSEFSSFIATKRHIWPGKQDGADLHGQNVSGHAWGNLNWC